MKKLILTVALGFLLFASSAFGQSFPNNMTFTGALDGSSWDNAYTGVYGATINTVSTGMICDDFKDEITSGESWTAIGFNASYLFNNWHLRQPNAIRH